MNSDALPEDWNILTSWLPQDLNILARECGFFRRASGLQDASQWLRLILMHVAGGLLVKKKGVRGGGLNFGGGGSVAVFKNICGEGKVVEKSTGDVSAQHGAAVGDH